MIKPISILKKISVTAVLAAFSLGCDQRGAGTDYQSETLDTEESTGTAAAIVGRPAEQRIRYVLDQTDHVADHEGIRIILTESILFEAGEATLKEDAREKMEQVSEVLHYYEGDPIKISGHADDEGDPASNKELSQQRAEAVKQYFVSNFNIAADRIEAVGYGNEFPITGEDSREAFAGKEIENRRVEIKVITTKGVPEGGEAVTQDEG